jgi:hypothetical protein
MEGMHSCFLGRLGAQKSTLLTPGAPKTPFFVAPRCRLLYPIMERADIIVVRGMIVLSGQRRKACETIPSLQCHSSRV